MTELTTLASVDLFKDLPESLLQEILAFSEVVNKKAEERIFSARDEARHLFILLEGTVAIRMRLTSRPETVTVSIINRPYRTFGWSGVVAPFHYTANADCEEDVRLLSIDGHKLMEVLERHPEQGFIVMRRMTEIISDRLRNSHMALLMTL